MKRGVLKLVLVLLLCSVCCMCTTADISVENSVSVSGAGVLDHYIEAQTEYTHNGQKYTEWVRTPSLGWYGVSKIDVRVELAMMTGNKSDIATEGDMESDYTTAMYCMRNYDLGAIQEFLYDGNTTLSYMFMADNFSSLMVAEGATKGYTEFNIVLKDINTTKPLYDERFTFRGVLGYDIESYIENVSYPGAMSEDWLGCP